MVNVLWFLLLGGGVTYAFFTGQGEAVTSGAVAAVNEGVEIILGLLGVMCLWTGLFRIAEASGLVHVLSKILTPLVRKVFPSVPKGHPAMDAIVMNVSANLLGLGNAATPFGLQAMEHLQSLNPNKDVATPAMITLMVMNTACITLMPVTMIGLRAEAGSQAPAAIWPATLLSSITGMAFGLILDACLRKRSRL